MTLAKALSHILPFRKAHRDDETARELDLEKFIAERQHGLTVEQVDEIERKAIADAGIDEDEIRKEIAEYMREHKARPA